MSSWSAIMAAAASPPRWTASAAAWWITGCIPSARSTTNTATSWTRLPNGTSALTGLCELNVMRQVRNVASDVFVQDAWARGQALHVHGWVYSLANGLVKDLNVTMGSQKDIERLF